MEYPPVKPHHIALHELQKDYQYDRYKASFDDVLALAGNDPFAQLEVCYYYYDTYVAMGKWEDVQQMIQIAREIPSSDAISHRVLHLLLKARQNLSLNDIELFDAEIDQALSLLEEKSGDLYFMVQLVKCDHYAVQLKIDEGLTLCREIIEKAENNLVYSIAIAYSHFGGFYRIIHELDEAEISYQHALRLSQQLGYRKLIAGQYSNLGTIAISRFIMMSATEDNANKYLSAAIHYFHLALETINHTSDISFKIRILSNLSGFYSTAKKNTEAIKYGQEALSVARSTMMPEHLVVGLFTLSMTLQTVDQYSESLTLSEECTAYSHFLPDAHKVSLYEMLSHTCSHLGLFEKGLIYSQKHVELLKEFHEEQKEGALYHNKLLLEKLHQQEKNIHHLQLRSVEEKMQSQAMQLVSQTELLAKFRDELREIARRHPADNPGMREVKEKLKALPCSQIDWTKFEAQFNEVHPEFQGKLAEKYPELTEMERRIALMVRMHLKSVDIAKLFCITERAVEFHRLNLRKKLHLASGETLPSFLQSI